ncbi:uncharacterized protein C8Q71DRAFT_734149 [Rhodofomes roseus]|uniref:Knr4/Smi1-like domain-containing protein n=1 Tax=Rhodofomes roseus TaxID=34475 RepID=A0ABQ8KW21_9APHY|nr:uncharacterized protein C8Q71DRAFT_734149 [Rhodofomes roseus]KAH9842724.1 hypothetical protein C8Q71DRAFT_734149 [Rhodofomes roseus]
MSWLANLFSSSKTTVNSRRASAMSSTHDAFSLPTSSPGIHPHPDAFNAEMLTSPTSSGSYSYPPASSRGSYDYVPTGTRSRQSSILPLHSNASLPPLPSYPPLSHTWDRLRRWLSREYPELGDTLNYGILPQDLQQIEMTLGMRLPTAVRDSYLCVDGQEAESAAGCSEGLFFGLTLLPLEDVLEEWSFWREVDDDPSTGANQRLKEVMQSIPPKWVKREYTCRGWIPLATDKTGNYIGIDMTPDEEGKSGQVIVFGRDFDTKVVMFRGEGEGGWGKWLAGFVDDLESGEGYELGSTNDGSEGSEDSIGYESYFFDGVGGGQGDTGGDAGTGGLRMTGEYKGWRVLEAWADRSVRKWQEAGLYSNDAYPPWEKGKGMERFSLDHVPLVGAGGSGAEVPIPVFSDASGETTALTAAPEPLRNATNKSKPATRQSVPTISVTKPPAPLPLELPTPEAIDSPIFASRQLPDDIEAGTAIREFDASSVSSPPAKASPLSSATSPPLKSIRVPSPPSRSLTDSPDTIHATSPTAPIPDLLTPTSPTTPTPAAPAPLVAATVDLESSANSGEDSPVLIHADDVEPEDPIRLVGGGGISGTVDDSMQNDIVIVDDPQSVELKDVDLNGPASPTAADTTPTSEKRKSITASLKSFGRRKDSVSSMKGSG